MRFRRPLRTFAGLEPVSESTTVLTLTFLGVGSAFAKRNFQSNAMIEAWTTGPDAQDVPDDNLLVDFGATGPLALDRLKNTAGFEYLRQGDQIRYSSIRSVFVTHTHSDHIGGLEELAAMNLYQGEQTEGHAAAVGFRPRLIATASVHDLLWSRSLSGGLGAMNGREAQLEDFFRPTRVDPEVSTSDGAFSLQRRYAFDVFATDHIRIQKKYDWPSFGLTIRDMQSGRSVVYSGDTRLDVEPNRARFETASMIFHDVQLHEHPGAVHCTIRELRDLPTTLKQKMTLYHYGDTWDAPEFGFVDRDFAGFAKPGVRYTLFE